MSDDADQTDRYPLDHSRGFAPLARDLVRLEAVIQHPVACTVYVALLMRARYEAGWVRGSHGHVHLERGECLVGERELADLLKQPASTIRRALGVLQQCGLITRKAERKGSRISIRHYGEFGDSWRSSGAAAVQQRSSGGAAAEPKDREIGESGEEEEEGEGEGGPAPALSQFRIWWETTYEKYIGSSYTWTRRDTDRASELLEADGLERVQEVAEAFLIGMAPEWLRGRDVDALSRCYNDLNTDTNRQLAKMYLEQRRSAAGGGA